jgi:adenine-specific DNA-methyltransferase
VNDSYESLSKTQLIHLLRKRDSERRLGLVWERNEIEADRAIDANFVACQPIVELSDGPGPWRNLVIEGDNFDALRWLRMTYAKRVKCIYIDPPYNTGNRDWVYNDHFVDRSDAWRHSTWLEFLYRRISIARELLSPDGVILVSINDENRSRLDLLLEQTLPGMRIGSLTWRTRDTTSAKGRNFSDVHEHILVYGGDQFSFRGSDKLRNKYKNVDNDPRGDWNVDPLTLAFDRIDRPNLYYPLHNPETDIWYPCDPDRVWCFASRHRLKPGQKTRSEPMEAQVEQGLIVFPSSAAERVVIWNSRSEVEQAIRSGDIPVTPRDGKPLIRIDDDLDFWVGKRVGFGRPGLKKFWKDLRSHIAPFSSWIARLGERDEEELVLARTGSGGEGTNEIQEIFGSKIFQNPKPVRLIRQLLDQATARDDLVLDFFAGSATTAQAVMELNAADGGGRKFIMVSSTEATVENPDKNLCRDVTAERVRRLNQSTDEKYGALYAPFAYLRMREIEFGGLDYELAPQEVWAALEAMHGLPLTAYRGGLAAQEHETGDLALVLVDRADPEVIARLRKLRQRCENVFAYSWAPGQLSSQISGFSIEVRPVRETLVRRFQQ